MSKDSKEPWIDPARATFLYTVVKRAVDKREADKRRSTQDQGRGEEGSDVSPDAPIRPAGPPARSQGGGSPFATTYLLGMWLNVTLAAFHIRGHLPPATEVEWVVAGWLLAGAVVFVVSLLLSSKEAGWGTYGFAGLTIVAILWVGGICGVLFGMGVVFLVSGVLLVGALCKK